MKTIEYLSDPVLRETFLPGLLAGACAVAMGAAVSPLVVVKRLGFIGQGISHSAFGGVGVAAVLAALGVGRAGSAWELAVIGAFCVAAALGMGAMTRAKHTSEDTAIGLFLVVSMAGGALLVALARQIAPGFGRPVDARSWESILFGSLTWASMDDAALAAIVLGVVLLGAWGARRAMLFWALDEETARAFGVPTGIVRAVLMVLLALVVVTCTRVAGVVLASALLVLPGATALRLSDRLWCVVALSLVTGLTGLVGGFVAAMELNWQPGPCIVLTMALLLGAAWPVGWLRDRAPAASVGA